MQCKVLLVVNQTLLTYPTCIGVQAGRTCLNSRRQTIHSNSKTMNPRVTWMFAPRGLLSFGHGTCWPQTIKSTMPRSLHAERFRSHVLHASCTKAHIFHIVLARTMFPRSLHTVQSLERPRDCFVACFRGASCLGDSAMFYQQQNSEAAKKNGSSLSL